MAEGKLLLIDYMWSEHCELKQLFQDVIPYCIRNVTPKTGQHVIVEPSQHYAIRFRCTDDLEVNKSIFDRAVAEEDKKWFHYRGSILLF